jgi:hypothetical protein
MRFKAMLQWSFLKAAQLVICFAASNFNFKAYDVEICFFGMNSTAKIHAGADKDSDIANKSFSNMSDC